MADLDDLAVILNTELGGLISDVESLSTTLTQLIPTLSMEIDHLNDEAIALKELAEQPVALLQSAATTAKSRVEELFETVQTEVDQVQQQLVDNIAALSAEIDGFHDDVGETIDHFSVQMAELLQEPLEAARQRYSEGLQALVDDAKSEIIEPALEHIQRQVEKTLNDGLHEVEQFFHGEAAALADQIDRALQESLKGNAAMSAATDELAPIMDQLKPLTESVASLASSVGIS